MSWPPPQLDRISMKGNRSLAAGNSVSDRWESCIGFIATRSGQKEIALCVIRP
jgi:hypothetical protein